MAMCIAIGDWCNEQSGSFYKQVAPYRTWLSHRREEVQQPILVVEDTRLFLYHPCQPAVPCGN